MIATLVALAWVHHTTVARTFEVLSLPTLEKALLAARDVAQDSYARDGANAPELRERTDAIERGLLLMTEASVLRRELAVHLAVSGVLPIVLVFAVLSVVLLGWVRSWFRPLDALTEAARGYAVGTGRRFPTEIGGTDDVRALARALDAMVATIERQSSALAVASRAQGWRDVAREVVHEARNALTSLRLTAEGVLEASAGSSDVERRSEALLNGIRQLERMTTALRNLAETRTPNPSRVALGPLLAEVVALHADRVDRIEASPTSEHVVADADLLRQALSNLIVNAVEAGARTIRLRAETRAGLVAILCTDDGPGMADVARATRLGFTTKPNGTGFGLYFVDKVLAEMRGFLRVASTPDAGTTVELELPRADDPRSR
jgi:signal transduction histidine kinase